MSNDQRVVSDPLSILTIAAELDKSIDPFQRALGRSMRAMLVPIMKHQQDEALKHWGDNIGIELSMRATARTLGIAVYLLAIGASRGNIAAVGKFMEAYMRDIDDAAAEQRRQMKIVPPANSSNLN
jgi:hypothetical protein